MHNLGTIPIPEKMSLVEINKQADNFFAVARSTNSSIQSEEDCRALGQLSYDLRIPISIGLTNIYMINNKPSPSANLLHALVMRSGQMETMRLWWEDDEVDGLTCCIHIKRKNGIEYSTSFSEKDSRIAELDDKDNWRKYPRNMMIWRVIKNAHQVVFPDVISGMYSPDELGSESEVFTPEDIDINGDDDGEIIDADYTVADPDNLDKKFTHRTDSGRLEVDPEYITRINFEQAWADAHKEGVNVEMTMKEFNAERGRFADDKLTDEEMKALTRRLHYAIESVF